ncbi:hypothetical protein D187_006948 [Cystobacter fuscus DSM 2262]|uniref:PNPLA domain-containing protein n=1 Tax=Cystobacter fuscus (strain ATCC 25194 / DSM 2262 / NBRC 100088 / M29) TaxID=1242864 RepID=S9Q7A0_CYSF2|nr:hypothetical protein D187_006948 [Cystobacter fuscus DSM 2262]
MNDMGVQQAHSKRTHEPENVKNPLLEEGRALAALSRSELGGLGPSQLLRMYRSGRARWYAPGERLSEQGPGFWVVLDGQLELWTRDDKLLATLGRSSICGVEEGLEGGAEGAWVLFVENHDARGRLPRTRSQRASTINYLHLPSTERPLVCEVIQLRSRKRLNLGTLLELLAKTLVNDFKEKVVIVGKGTRPKRPPGRPTPPYLFHASIEEVKSTSWLEEFDYVFAADEEAARVLKQHHHEFQHTTIELTRDPPTRSSPRPGEDILRTHLLPVSPSPVHGGLEGSANPGELLLGQRSCWLHLPDDILSGARTEFETLDERTREHLSRWARVITHRQVGLGLSGGGAWGFYHYVVLEKLTREKIPIDIITGSSIGSVMGAYYSVHGMDGLEHFRNRCSRGELNQLTWLNMLSTSPLETLLRKDLNNAQLDQLSLRMHPVAINLSTGETTTFTRGPLSLAVRASSSAPGLWGPTLLNPRHFVDGAAADNLPALWLPHLGADLTFSCNCYPAQLRPYRQLIPGPIGRLLKELNPVERLMDLVSSGSTLLHASGSLGARMSTRAFQKSPMENSLLRSIDFRRAKEIIEHARQDLALNESLERFVADWEKLRTRHRQVRGPELQYAIH